MTLVFVLKVVKRGFSPSIAIGTGLARLGIILKSFEKESVLMNLCKVNRKIPDLRDIPLPKMNKQHDQLQQTLSNARVCLFCSVSVMNVGVLE